MDDDGIAELEARVTLVEMALALLLGREGLDQLRIVLREDVEEFRASPPSSLTAVEAGPKLRRHFHHMEDRLDVLERIALRHGRSTPPPAS